MEKNEKNAGKQGYIKKSNRVPGESLWVLRDDDVEYAMRITSREKIDVIRAGVAKKHLVGIKEQMGLDYDELSVVLSASRATLINKKTNEKFDSQISERLVLLNDVLAHGRDVFQDNDIFNDWLRTKSRALGNITPLSMMDTIHGMEEVKREIGRIAHGVF